MGSGKRGLRSDRTDRGPQLTDMREYVEPTPVDLQAFSTGRILKESWEISTKYFGALVMPMVLIVLACLPIMFIIPGKGGELMNNILSSIFCPIAIMGLHHSILKLKSEGLTPTFSRTFSSGNEYWWRGIKIGMMSGIYALVLVIAGLLASAILFVPGILLADKEPVVAGVLFVLAGIVFLSIMAWFGCRACLAYSAMADHHTSATKAFDLGWSLTKGNEGKTLRLGLVLTGLSIAVVIGFFIVGAILAGLEILGEPLIIGPLVLAALFAYFFLLSFTHVALNLAYQVLKPAPAEESPLPVA